MKIETIGSATLYLGDSLQVLQSLEAGTADAVITDPPYSSGGAFRGDRAVVGCNGQIVFDPHPSRAGLAGDPGTWEYSYLVKVDVPCAA